MEGADVILEGHEPGLNRSRANEHSEKETDNCRDLDVEGKKHKNWSRILYNRLCEHGTEPSAYLMMPSSGI
jgi:hypothetical protein